MDTRLILDRCGIEHDGRHARCPGCGEPGALICRSGGIKCLHNRCSNVGPRNHPGLRTNVDLVAEHERVPPYQAARLVCEWFGLDCGPDASGVGAGSSAWKPLVPLERASSVPFPTHALPATLRVWVEAESVATQTAPDLAAVVALATISACVAKKFEVEVRAGWHEPLNTYWLVALEPGNRKSAVFRAAVHPLQEYESALVDRLRAPMQAAMARREIKQRALKKALDYAARTGAPEDRQHAEELAVDLDSERVPIVPRLVVDDVTPERLAAMLAEQGGRLALLSAEGGLFEVAGGRYSDGVPNLDVLLKSHPGDDLRVDRIGRAPVHVRRPALTLGLATQPEVIRELSRKQGFRGSGLLARFFYSLPESWVGRRHVAPPPVPSEIVARYRRLYWALLSVPERGERNGELVPFTLRFSTEARQRIEAFSRELEPRLGMRGELVHISDWANKLPGGVARIATLLHLAEWADAELAVDPGSFGNSGSWDVESVAANPSERVAPTLGSLGSSGSPIPDSLLEVSGDAVERAVLVGRYLIDHVQAAFDLMGADPAVEKAKRVLSWILRSNLSTFSKRDAWQGTRGSFHKAAELDGPLSLLCEHGYLREESLERAGSGRKPSPIFSVNPLSHNAQNAPSASEPSEGEIPLDHRDSNGSVHAEEHGGTA